MKILVCVKQVLDPDGPVRIDTAGRGIEAVPGASFRMNRFDEYALEEALRIREAFPGTHIDALSVGPERCSRTVRRALELGADEGIHLLLGDECYRTPFEIASLIGQYAGRNDYDLVLTGFMAEDDMQAQVGPMLAEMLGYPWATAVMAVRWPLFPGTILVERELESGRREVLEIRLPALITVQSGINLPRYPALSHVLRARSRALVTIPVSRQCQEPVTSWPEPRERIAALTEPAPEKTGLILSGTPGEKAEKLLRLLQERALL